MLSSLSALSALVIGYLLGSIPFGLLLTRMKGLGDVRHVGSGNIGATNVSRLGGKWLGLITLLLDAGKGALAVALILAIAPEAASVAAFSAVLGHVFPIWLGFKGGKGIATLLGAFLVFSPLVASYAFLVFFVTLVLTRYVSLASLCGVAASPLIAFFLGEGEMALLGILVTLLVLFTHRQNIQRLLSGQEARLGDKLVVARKEKRKGGTNARR